MRQHEFDLVDWGPWSGTQAQLGAKVGAFQLLVSQTSQRYNWSVHWCANGALLNRNNHECVFRAQDLCLMAVANYYVVRYDRFFYQVKGRAELKVDLAWNLIAGGLVDVAEMNARDLCLYQPKQTDGLGQTEWD